MYVVRRSVCLVRMRTGSRFKENLMESGRSSVNAPGESTVVRVTDGELRDGRYLITPSAGTTLEVRGERGFVVVSAKSCSEEGIRWGRRRKVSEGAMISKNRILN